jgi:hypothetical protein
LGKDKRNTLQGIARQRDYLSEENRKKISVQKRETNQITNLFAKCIFLGLFS